MADHPKDCYPPVLTTTENAAEIHAVGDDRRLRHQIHPEVLPECQVAAVRSYCRARAVAEHLAFIQTGSDKHRHTFRAGELPSAALAS